MLTPQGVEGYLSGRRDLPVDQVALLIYDGRVGYLLTVKPESVNGDWEMVLLIRLSRAEANDLFLAGDKLVAWPVEGLVEGGDPGRERTSMFVSEIAGRPSGLRIRYAERGQVERAQVVMRSQLAEAGLEEEPD